jgi:disulfide bond formation protein DsbB
MPTIDHTPSPAWTPLFLAWLTAAASTLSALFIGEVIGYTPCVLCWYQRIAMFPLVFVLAAGLFPFDRNVVRYALPLAIVGGLVALWHLALVVGLIPESAVPCRQGVSCKDQVVLFGWLNLPLLSVLAFSFIIAMLLIVHRKGSKQ